MDEVTKHYLISGRVQGVGFRAFTQRTAAEFQLSGWVRNLQDGRVEAMAFGPADKLKFFEAKLKVGPAHGHVENLVIGAGILENNHKGFEVRKDSGKPWGEK